MFKYQLSALDRKFQFPHFMIREPGSDLPQITLSVRSKRGDKTRSLGCSSNMFSKCVSSVLILIMLPLTLALGCKHLQHGGMYYCMMLFAFPICTATILIFSLIFTGFVLIVRNDITEAMSLQCRFYFSGTCENKYLLFF